jgi:limonene 1,2-monooxygenase
MWLPERMQFGIFLGPFHRVGENGGTAGSGIKRLAEQSGGFGGFLVQTVDWSPREKMLHSYELLARYVMPQSQGTAFGTAASNTWAYERRERLMAGRMRAIEHARTDYAERHAGERTS